MVIVVRLVFDVRLMGAVDWWFNPELSLPRRLLSLYHAALPVLLLWGVWKLGYDRRALPIQVVITFAAVGVGRLAGRAYNINASYVEFVTGTEWSPAFLHFIMVTGLVTLVVYAPTHVALSRWFGSSPPNLGRKTGTPDA